MPGRADHVVQSDAITKVVESAPNSSAFKSHVRQVIASPAFKGSRRSQQFLQFVVENALDGHFGELKERSLGIKLFDRAPSYNTADDAIVRVTACDVRTRLLQYYADVDSGSEFRIELSPGSYIPEFQRTPYPTSVVIRQKPQSQVWYIAAAICVGLIVWLWATYRLTSPVPSAERLLPWSVLFQANRAARNSKPDMASCGKAFTSIACGIMLKKKHDLIPQGLDTKVFTKEYLPEAFPLDDPAKADITLGELLVMTAGFHGEANKQGYTHNKNLEPVPQDRSLGMDMGAIRYPLWCKPGPIPHLLRTSHPSFSTSRRHGSERLDRPEARQTHAMGRVELLPLSGDSYSASRRRSRQHRPSLDRYTPIRLSAPAPREMGEPATGPRRLH